MDNIYENLDASLTVVGIYLDLTKAFDSLTMIYYFINYKIMEFEVLHIIGVSKSYLSNRQQYTVINNVSSSFTRVQCGVPQGSTP